jgi:ribA/ribD-fused uncharacterized protein
MVEPIYFLDENQPFFEFSNFSPHGFVEDRVYWPTVEHYFQAQKFPGSPHQEAIRKAATPEQAKQLGRSREHPLRPDWSRIREEVMKNALRHKFADPALRALLLGTGDRLLIEHSPHDPYWGCGPDGRGQNRAGVLLMEVREELRRAEHPGERPCSTSSSGTPS